MREVRMNLNVHVQILLNMPCQGFNLIGTSCKDHGAFNELMHNQTLLPDTKTLLIGFLFKLDKSLELLLRLRAFFEVKPLILVDCLPDDDSIGEVVRSEDLESKLGAV